MTTIGILGGGQLGRMMVLAAAPLGLKTHVFCQSEDEPAAQFSRTITIAPWQDHEALRRFAEDTDVITFEFENIPVEALEHLKQFRPVRPDPRCLEVTQDRIAEKKYFKRHGLATTPWSAADTEDEARAFLERENLPYCFLKTTRLGYDGKGQWLWAPGRQPYPETEHKLIAEAPVDFAGEISVITVRNRAGEARSYDPGQNIHDEGILRTTRVPAPWPEDILICAQEMAEKLADALDYIGILGVEFFVTQDRRLLVNECAPRPHNSGHWTLDACMCSQFENHMRAVADLPLGPVTRFAVAEMQNLIGHEADKALSYLTDPAARLHLYGKKEARPGRKMGHVNFVKD